MAAPLELNCWVYGESPRRIFSVKIQKTETVATLKKAIKNEKRAFQNHDADSLTLWQVSIFVDGKQKPQRPPSGEEVSSVIRLSTLFPDVPKEGHLHIIVGPPPGATITPSSSTGSNLATDDLGDDTETRRLRVFCEKYWNQGDKGRAEIYKNETIQVPFAKRPVGGVATEPGYMTLDPKTGPLPLGDISKGSNEEFSDLDESDFDNGMPALPVSYESLSLGSLGRDFRNFFDNGYSSILVRNEYRDMFTHILNLCKSGERGVVVTGTPGIGKSIFLYFLLIERILEGKPTAYQQIPNRTILITDSGEVRIIPDNKHLDPEGFPGVWALVDSNVALVQPRAAFTDSHSEFFLVHSSSPQPVRWKAWTKKLSASIAVMKPWSWEEFYIGGTVFLSSPLKDSTLRDVFVKYGRSPRFGYGLAKDPSKVDRLENDIPCLFNSVPEISTLEARLAGLHHTANDVIKFSSDLLTIVPDRNRQPRVTLVSRHIAQHFFKAVRTRDDETFWLYFKHFSSVAESRVPAGWLWELHAIRELSNKMKATIVMRHLPHVTAHSRPPSKKRRIAPASIELPFSEVTPHGNKEALGKELSRVIHSSRTKPTLFTPAARNQVTFDALSISGDNLITLYQATIRTSHSIKAKGLDFIWDALTLADPSNVKKALPSAARKWRLVFLIPQDVEKDWNAAEGIDFGGIKPKRAWDEYVEQFVVVLSK